MTPGDSKPKATATHAAIDFLNIEDTPVTIIRLMSSFDPVKPKARDKQADQLIKDGKPDWAYLPAQAISNRIKMKKPLPEQNEKVKFQ